MQATEGSDKFGAANAAARVHRTSEVEKNNGVDEVIMKSLEGYFDNLATAAVNKKSFLEQLVANNAQLAATNKEWVAIVKKIVQQNQGSQKGNLPPPKKQADK